MVANAVAADDEHRGGENKISVEVFVEAFCPFSELFVSRALRPALKADGVADLVDLKFAQCGHCRPNATQDTGFECQHGAGECSANKMIACGVDEAESEKGPLAVSEFAACMYSLPKGWMVDAGYGRQCAEEAGLNAAAIFACGTTDAGNEKLRAHYELSLAAGVAEKPVEDRKSAAAAFDPQPIRNAVRPLRNPVPWVIVDGKVLEDPLTVHRAICDAQRARRRATPSGCDDPPPPPTDEVPAAAAEDGSYSGTVSSILTEKKEATEKELVTVKKVDAKRAEASTAAADPIDADKINADVMRMIADEMAAAAEERRQAKELDAHKKGAKFAEEKKPSSAGHWSTPPQTKKTHTSSTWRRAKHPQSVPH